MNGADAAVALARGDVAMGCAFGGPLQRMKEFGQELMTASEQEAIGIRVFDVVSVTEDFAQDHPDLLRGFMDVTDRANAAYEGEPGRYLETISQAAGMDLGATEDMLGMFSFPSAAEQKSDAWMGGTVQVFTKEVADFFVEQGQLDGRSTPTISPSTRASCELTRVPSPPPRWPSGGGGDSPADPGARAAAERAGGREERTGWTVSSSTTSR